MCVPDCCTYVISAYVCHVCKYMVTVSVSSQSQNFIGSCDMNSGGGYVEGYMEVLYTVIFSWLIAPGQLFDMQIASRALPPA